MPDLPTTEDPKKLKPYDGHPARVVRDRIGPSARDKALKTESAAKIGPGVSMQTSPADMRAAGAHTNADPRAGAFKALGGIDYGAPPPVIQKPNVLSPVSTANNAAAPNRPALPVNYGPNTAVSEGGQPVSTQSNPLPPVIPASVVPPSTAVGAPTTPKSYQRPPVEMAANRDVYRNAPPQVDGVVANTGTSPFNIQGERAIRTNGTAGAPLTPNGPGYNDTGANAKEYDPAHDMLTQRQGNTIVPTYKGHAAGDFASVSFDHSPASVTRNADPNAPKAPQDWSQKLVAEHPELGDPKHPDNQKFLQAFHAQFPNTPWSQVSEADARAVHVGAFPNRGTSGGMADAANSGARQHAPDTTGASPDQTAANQALLNANNAYANTQRADQQDDTAAQEAAQVQKTQDQARRVEGQNAVLKGVRAYQGKGGDGDPFVGTSDFWGMN